MKDFFEKATLITSWIGIYTVISAIWRWAEKMQFGADIYKFSRADTMVCLIISAVLAFIFVMEASS